MYKKKLKYFAMMAALLLALGACKKEENKPKGNLAELTTSAAWNIGVSTAASGGYISSDGGTPITARGVCYSGSPNPTIDKPHTTDGTGTGSYSSHLTGLAPSTPYYARAYATNGAGTAYGQQVQFVTQMAATIVSISPLQVKVGEEITFTIKGANMTDGMSFVVEDLEGVTELSGGDSFQRQFKGTATGTAGIKQGYIKASAEGSTFFSFQVEFTITHPSLSTASVTDIGATTATTGGNISSDGGSPVTARGVCYSTNPNPTIHNSITKDGSGAGSYSSQLTNLSNGTTYYVRAYATNALGTAYGQQKSFFTNLTIEKVDVQGGTFMMGSPDAVGWDHEHPQHQVTLSSFSISKYETTNAQFAAFMTAIGANANGYVGGTEYLDMDATDCQITHNGSTFVAKPGQEQYPVIEVTWYGAKAFAELAGGRLPTEAEWEYAARGGNQSQGYTYSGSNNIDAVAWYDGNSGGNTHIVGTKAPNELGIYDMSGNVFEWCSDWYDRDYYSSSPNNNPQGPNSGSYRVLRGGSWRYVGSNCRVAFREYRYYPHQSYNNCGFRVVFP